MGRVICLIILDGEDVQGGAEMLKHKANASCVLVGYLEQDADVNFNQEDARPIVDFHIKANKQLARLSTELDALNRDLAAKYNLPVS
jgi:hypothetical protein